MIQGGSIKLSRWKHQGIKVEACHCHQVSKASRHRGGSIKASRQKHAIMVSRWKQQDIKMKESRYQGGSIKASRQKHAMMVPAGATIPPQSRHRVAGNWCCHSPEDNFVQTIGWACLPACLLGPLSPGLFPDLAPPTAERQSARHPF